MCPGKRQPEAATGPWDRDLAVDLGVIHSFGAKTLITLMEHSELVAANLPAAQLAEATAAIGLAWHHWPIVDLGVPSGIFEVLWRTEAKTVCQTLSHGDRVVVHCRGGRGRSGLVAARFLIELGLPNEEAFRAVRAVQPLAMESPQQEHHVRTFAPALNFTGP
jgi:protein-tyrosine phosphatase